MLVLTIMTAGKFDQNFKLGHLMNNFANAVVLATLMSKACQEIKWLKAESWMEPTCEYMKKPISFLVDFVWYSFLALDVETFDTDLEPDTDEEKDVEPTVGEIVTKLSEVFFLFDHIVLDKEFARIIRRDSSHLLATNVMIRSIKKKKFWSSSNLEKGLGEVRGFLPLEELVIVAENTPYNTY